MSDEHDTAKEAFLKMLQAAAKGMSGNGVQIELIDAKKVASLIEDEDEDEKGVVVGKASLEMARSIHEHRVKRNQIKQDYHRRIDEFLENLNFEADQVSEEMTEAHQALWNRIYEELGLDPTKHYSMRMPTREVILLEQKEEVEHDNGKVLSFNKHLH